mgnify:CR=1 FL=1
MVLARKNYDILPSKIHRNYIEMGNINNLYYDINRYNIEKYIIKNETIINSLLIETQYSYENCELYLSEEEYNTINQDTINKKNDKNISTYFITHRYFYHEIDSKELVFVHKNTNLGGFDFFFGCGKYILVKISWSIRINENILIPNNFKLSIINNDKEIPIYKFASRRDLWVF